MRKFDFIIISVVLLIAVGAFFFINRQMSGRARVSVVSEGVEIQSVALPDTPMEITLENRHGRNTLRLTRYGAEVICASCPTQICVRTGKITNSRQMIVCLPHYLVITLSSFNGEDNGGEHDSVDAVAR